MTGRATSRAMGSVSIGIACLVGFGASHAAVGAKPRPRVAATHDRYEVVLRPLTGPDKIATAIAVKAHVTRATAGPFVLHAPIAAPGVPHLADGITHLEVNDGQGAVSLEQSDVSGVGGKVERVWTASRPVGETVEISYLAALVPPAQGGPPTGIKAAGGGVAGNTSSFLLLPRGLRTRQTVLDWDLSALSPGSIGVSGAGVGRVTIAGPPEAAADQWVLAGPAIALHRPGASRFNGYVIGEPAVDAAGFLSWSERAYGMLETQFRYLHTPRYQLLVRALDGPSFATGTAKEGGGSALVTLGQAFINSQDAAYLRGLTFHEMTHQWVGELTPESSWFSEGLTVYFSIRLGCQLGLKTAAECADEVNQTAKMFYTSPGRTLSQAAIEHIAFKQESVRTTAYGRGMLYFAALDAQIRQRSHGARTLMMALQPLFRARQKGIGLTQARFELMLDHELGRSAVQDFRAIIIEGRKEPLPAANAFGAPLQRVPRDWGTPTAPARGFAWQIKTADSQR